MPGVSLKEAGNLTGSSEPGEAGGRALRPGSPSVGVVEAVLEVLLFAVGLRVRCMCARGWAGQADFRTQWN